MTYLDKLNSKLPAPKAAQTFLDHLKILKPYTIGMKRDQLTKNAIKPKLNPSASRTSISQKKSSILMQKTTTEMRNIPSPLREQVTFSSTILRRGGAKTNGFTNTVTGGSEITPDFTPHDNVERQE